MPTNVLVQTAFLGDLLLSIPLLKQIKSFSPEPLVLVCRQGLGEFFLKSGLVDQVIEIIKGDSKSYQKAAQELQKLQINTIYAPHQSLRTHFFISRLKALKKVGFATWWNYFYFDHRIKKNMSLPEALRQQSLMGFKDVNLEDLIKKYQQSGQAYQVLNNVLSAPPTWSNMSLKNKILEDQSTWTRFLERKGLSAKRNRPWVLVFPGSVWATKRWTTEGFGQVCKKLLEQKFEVFVMGAPNEEKLCQDVAAFAPGSNMFAGQTTIYESALMLARSVLVIGNDSASIHLAACAETPTISIFGPTVIEFGFRAWSDKAYLLQHPKLACRPCGPHGHQQCPLKHHRCMKEISADSVLALAQKIILQNNL